MANPAPNWNKFAGWMVIAAQQTGADAFPLSHAILRALWAEEQDTSDPALRRRIADDNGFDGEALLAAEMSEPVRE
jgi:2-hydroxychromene-2-carboxylate isomerase